MPDPALPDNDEKPDPAVNIDPVEEARKADEAAKEAKANAAKAADAVALKQADFELAQAQTKRDLAVQAADAKRDKAKADAEAKFLVAQRAAQDESGKKAALVTAQTAKLADVPVKKSAFDEAVAAHVKALEAQATAKANLDSAAAKLKEAQAAKDGADAAVLEASTAIAASQDALDKVTIAEKAAEALKATQLTLADAQHEVDVKKAELDLANAVSARNTAIAAVWKAAKDRAAT